MSLHDALPIYGARGRRNRDGARIDDRDGAQGAPSWTDPGSRIEKVLPRPRPGLTYESFGCRAPAFAGEGRGVARAIAQPLCAVQTAAPADRKSTRLNSSH